MKEIIYRLDGRKSFGIGFLNDSVEYEIRNKYVKICLGQKDVTWITSEHNTNNGVLIFEDFFEDFTYRTIEKEENLIPAHLILNFTAMLLK